jgi:hypothetical protein
VCAQVGNQRSHGVVTARVQTDVVRSLRHQRRDLHQSDLPRTSQKIRTHPTIRWWVGNIVVLSVGVAVPCVGHLKCR